jgi:small subunit ribosomal protein S6
MSLYECVFIARQDISASQVEELAKKFTDLLASEKGQVVKTEFCGLKSLAYRIRKNKKGHYVLFNIEASGPAIVEMERTMRIDENVLRYLTVTVDAFQQGQSALSQPQRSPREFRRGGDGSTSGRGFASKSSEDVLSEKEEQLSETAGE